MLGSGENVLALPSAADAAFCCTFSANSLSLSRFWGGGLVKADCVNPEQLLTPYILTLMPLHNRYRALEWEGQATKKVDEGPSRWDQAQAA